MADEQDKQDIRDQANRIFQHGLYEDSALNERSNYFLIAESMLVVAYTGLISSASAAARSAVRCMLLLAVAFSLKKLDASVTDFPHSTRAVAS